MFNWRNYILGEISLLHYSHVLRPNFSPDFTSSTNFGTFSSVSNDVSFGVTSRNIVLRPFNEGRAITLTVWAIIWNSKIFVNSRSLDLNYLHELSCHVLSASYLSAYPFKTQVHNTPHRHFDLLQTNITTIRAYYLHQPAS